MSEEKGKYGKEERQEYEYQIRDEASPRNYFSQVPNLVDEMKLSVYAYRLYGHLRRVAGESGKCWQNTKTLADVCNMSVGKISEAKEELEKCSPPLIRITSQRKADGGIYHEITITDIWQINNDRFSEGGVHHVNGGRSPHERTRSPHETKKNPLTQEEPTSASKNSEKELKAIIDAANASFDKELELMRLSAGKSWTKLPEAYHAYGKAFCAATGLEYVKKNLYDWIGVFEEWNAQRYMPQDVIAAVQAITDEGRAGTISAPRSITHKLNGIKVARITRERALQAKTTPEENGEPDWREQWALEQANRENVNA